MAADEPISPGATGRLAGSNSLQGALDALTRATERLHQTYSKAAPHISSFAGGYYAGRHAWSGGNNNNNTPPMGAGIPNGGMRYSAPPPGTPQWPGSSNIPPNQHPTNAPAAPMGAGRTNGGSFTFSGQRGGKPTPGSGGPTGPPPSPGGSPRAAGAGFAVGVAAGVYSDVAKRVASEADGNLAMHHAAVTTSRRDLDDAGYQAVYGRWTRLALSDSDAAGVVLSMQRSGYRPGTQRGNTYLEQNLGDIGLADPLMSGLQQQQTQMQWSSAPAFNSLRMLGTNTLKPGGGRLRSLDIAHQVMKAAGIGDGVKLSKAEIDAAMDPNSNLMRSLSAWESTGVITPDMHQDVINQIHRILTARENNIGFEELKRLNVESHGKGPEADAAKEQLREAGLHTGAQDKKDRARDERVGRVQRLDEFVEGLRLANTGARNFADTLNNFFADHPFLRDLVGWHGGVQSEGGWDQVARGGLAMLLNGASSVSGGLIDWFTGGGAVGAAWRGIFADGGVLPGYTPGRDVHKFYSPTGGLLEMSGGEGILRPEATQWLGGEEGIDRINSAAKQGRLPKQSFKDGGTFGKEKIKAAQDFAKDQVGKPYNMGGDGPDSFDCSGFMSAITNFLRGEEKDPYHRVGSTADFPWPGFKKGWGEFTIGSISAAEGGYDGSGTGHMAGTLGGLPVESYWGNGPSVSNRGAGDKGFTKVYHLGAASGKPVGNGEGSGEGSDPATSSTPTGGEGAGSGFGGAVGGTLIISELAVLAGAGGAGGGAFGSSSGSTGSSEETTEGTSGTDPQEPLPTGGGTPDKNKRLGKKMAKAYGWGSGSQWDALLDLWTKESGWHHEGPLSNNPTSSAYGIPQALIDLHDMPKGYYDRKVGVDENCEGYGGDPAIQIKWGLNYIKGKYGDPESALDHWLANHSYDKGAWELPKDEIAQVHKGEMIVPANEARQIREVLLSGHSYGDQTKGSGEGVVLQFQKDSINLHVGAGAAPAQGRALAREFAEELQKHETIQKLRGA